MKLTVPVLDTYWHEENLEVTIDKDSGYVILQLENEDYREVKIEKEDLMKIAQFVKMMEDTDE